MGIKEGKIGLKSLNRYPFCYPKKKRGSVNSLILSDLGRIQTCNLLSRNQVHYSVMLRGLDSVNKLVIEFCDYYCYYQLLPPLLP